MSFLNPVNEPVQRFKSTDAGAPQINYNSRVAGDVKAVLKACLVTGYGDVAGAGWSIVNEVNHVAEFVSPSADMSDYRLSIIDSSAASTTWRYYYKNSVVSPLYNAPVKAFTSADKDNGANGWQVMVTDQGMFFIEILQHLAVNKLSTRITYWGRVQSALTSTDTRNISFFNVGHNGSIAQPFFFYLADDYVHTRLTTHVTANISSANSNILSNQKAILNKSNVDLVSPIYLANKEKDLLIGRFSPMLSSLVNNKEDLYGISESVLDGRNVMSVCAGFDRSDVSSATEFARSFLIFTDYWEY